MKKVDVNTTVSYNTQGLVPAIVQDVFSKKVLMMAWMNEEAFNLTQVTREAHFWSRSRKQLWHKGETSGNTMQVKEILMDCDGDTLLLMVVPAGPACHTGHETCFYQTLEHENVG